MYLQAKYSNYDIKMIFTFTLRSNFDKSNTNHLS